MDSPIIEPMIFSTQNTQSVQQVLMEEVENVVKDLNLDKALGLDGFSPFFFQNFWSHI